MPVRQVGTQATWKTKRDLVTLPRLGPIGGNSIHETEKIAILLLLGHFQYFFQYLSLLIP